MNKSEIKTFLDSFNDKRERTIVIVDFSNVEKWRYNLGWRIGIDELSKLVRHFSIGSKFLRKFYYGSDYGKSEKNNELTQWSYKILDLAKKYKFDLITKRVKYIHSNETNGFSKKCDLDVEMAVDLIREMEKYDTAVIFSGDGDLVYVMRYLHDKFDKKFVVFGARGHTGREIQDALKEGIIDRILYADDFEYRLSMDRNIN